MQAETAREAAFSATGLDLFEGASSADSIGMLSISGDLSPGWNKKSEGNFATSAQEEEQRRERANEPAKESCEKQLPTTESIESNKMMLENPAEVGTEVDVTAQLGGGVLQTPSLCSTGQEKVSPKENERGGIATKTGGEEDNEAQEGNLPRMETKDGGRGDASSRDLCELRRERGGKRRRRGTNRKGVEAYE